MIAETRFTVGPDHADELGHMNHVAAVRFLEKARYLWYAQAGLWGSGAVRGEDFTLGTVVVNLNIDYLKECFQGEEFRVRTMPGKKGTKSFVLDQRVITPAGETAVRCRCTSVIMDLETRKVLPVPDSIGTHFTHREP
ncbi:MAG: acyl-CoA thioesterase [Gammaproteobacteria bacterium]|nr:acyl-CoA thioesterase [Gammaproteobacteria bacterium]MYD75016.1 acyl-CoA thioesterase [Gammaproteobacteria bacterium]MYJ51953.1 acyl-CoA thioesterase [Gammaproteobacteria bacterium]